MTRVKTYVVYVALYNMSVKLYMNMTEYVYDMKLFQVVDERGEVDLQLVFHSLTSFCH